MQKKRMLSLILAMSCTATLFGGCAGNDTGDDNTASGEHEVITMQAPFNDMAEFLDLLHEKYPEINLEIIPYSGKNSTAYMTSQLAAGDMTDIYVTSTYSPGQEDVSDRLIDLSGYDFTDNYSPVRLRDLSDNGALYFLPTYYYCYGVTYNETLLEANGWELPTSFQELEELAVKVKEAGYNLALDQIQLPGYGFQYLCNILDTTYLSTLDGRQWQADFLAGKTTVKDSPEMVEAISTLEKWKEVGMLTDAGDLTSDANTKAIMAEGNTLFMLGNRNTFTEEESTDKFGMMPYLSEDGTQNVLILNVSRYIGLNKHLEDEGNEQKLEDALHVMEVLSTLEGFESLSRIYANTSLLPLKDYVIPEDNYYKPLETELNAGMTAPFLYTGWENIIVPVGNAVIDYICGNATIDDVINAFDDNQYLLNDNSDAVYTTVTEKLDTADCAKLVGICFAQASGADLSLISVNKWYKDGGDLNTNGVSGCLFALPMTDQQITSILPTGWRGNIETVTLTGARIKELAETGYELDGLFYPYELVTPEGMTIDDDTTYTVAICGVADAVAEEGNLTDTGLLGLTAAQEYFGQFETLSKKDIIWE